MDEVLRSLEQLALVAGERRAVERRVPLFHRIANAGRRVEERGDIRRLGVAVRPAQRLVDLVDRGGHQRVDVRVQVHAAALNDRALAGDIGEHVVAELGLLPGRLVGERLGLGRERLPRLARPGARCAQPADEVRHLRLRAPGEFARDPLRLQIQLVPAEPGELVELVSRARPVAREVELRRFAPAVVGRRRTELAVGRVVGARRLGSSLLEFRLVDRFVAAASAPEELGELAGHVQLWHTNAPLEDSDFNGNVGIVTLPTAVVNR